MEGRAEAMGSLDLPSVALLSRSHAASAPSPPPSLQTSIDDADAMARVCTYAGFQSLSCTSFIFAHDRGRGFALSRTLHVARIRDRVEDLSGDQ